MEELDLYNKKRYKLGIFYNNKNNEKLFVPKGIGFGWTLNFANKWSYLILAGIIGVVISILIFALSQKS